MPRTVTGRVTYDSVRSNYAPGRFSSWLEFDTPVSKPVRHAVVEVVQAGRTLAATTTDDAGRYVATFATNAPEELQVVVLSRSLVPAIQVQNNTNQDAVYRLSAPVGAGEVDLHAPTGWDRGGFIEAQRLAAPFAVLDTLVTATTAVTRARPALSLEPLLVNWSAENSREFGDSRRGQIGTSHYDPVTRQLYVLGKAGVDIDEFDRHVLAHEWSHFLEATLGRSDNPGGAHGIGLVLDPRVAFGEGWANAMAALVLDDPIAFDCAWSTRGLTCSGWDTETVFGDDPTPSAFSEPTVYRALYDFADAPNAAEPFDTVSLGLGPLLDVMTGPMRTTEALTTLAPFVRALKEQPGVVAADVDAILARGNMGAMVDDFGRGDAALSAFYASPTLPFRGDVSLNGSAPPSSRDQNRFNVVTGTGSPITFSATSAYNLALTVFERGTVVAKANATSTGVERLEFPTQQGRLYILVLTGFGKINGEYAAALTIE